MPSSINDHLNPFILDVASRLHRASELMGDEPPTELLDDFFAEIGESAEAMRGAALVCSLALVAWDHAVRGTDDDDTRDARMLSTFASVSTFAALVAVDDRTTAHVRAEQAAAS